MGNANARALTEAQGGGSLACRNPGWNDAAEPERTRGAEVGAIERAVDAESGGKASRTTGEIKEAIRFAVLLHLRNAFKGFERADQDAASNSSHLGAHVEHEMVAIAEINICVTATQEHCAIARRRAAKVVGGGIALGVGFGFNDPTAESSAGEFARHDLADEKTSQGDGVSRQLGAA